MKTTNNMPAWFKEIIEREGDRHEFQHKGYSCLVKRVVGRSYHLCGYVLLDKGHPLHGVSYSDELPALKPALERRMSEPLGENPSMSVMLSCLCGSVEPRLDTVLDVHGGVTWSSELEGKWAIGFDCAHCDDYTWSPYDSKEYAAYSESSKQYRDLEYVKAQCQSLVEQIDLIASEFDALAAFEKGEGE